MVIRGKPRGNGRQLANYLLAANENEAVQVFDIRGTSQLNSVKYSLIEMSLTSEITKGSKGLYHAQINPAYGEDKAMSRKDWLRSAEILEEELKLTGQKRVMVMHEKNGRTHCHVVWERYDHENRKMVSDSYSRLAQDRARKAIESTLQQQPTPHRNVRKPLMKLELTTLWQVTNDGKGFVQEATKRGYKIATGTERPFMVIDQEGVSFDLVRQLDKIKTKDVRDRLQDLTLPTDKQAIKQVRQAQNQQAYDKAQEDAADKILRFQEAEAAQKDRQQLFATTLSAMKNNVSSITYEVTDKKITQAQEKAVMMLQQVKAAEAPEPKPETEKERLKRLYKEQIEQALGQQQGKQRGLSL